MKLLIMYSSPFPCYLVPRRSKRLPQQPTLEHPQPMFLPQYERPRLTPIQNWQTLNTYKHTYAHSVAHSAAIQCVAKILSPGPRSQMV